MPAAETIVASNGLFVLKTCLHCDYHLIGLPPEGKCPECGRHYDQQTIVLRGWARGRKANLLTGPPRDTIQLALIALLPSFFCFFIAGSGGPGLFGWISFLAAIPPVAIVALKLSRPESIAPSEVVLTTTGCSQATRKPTRSAVLDALIQLVSFSKDSYFHKRVHWRYIAQFRIWRNNSGRIRLRCDEGPWWNRRTPIDFEFDASTSDAAELRQRISMWRAAEIGLPMAT